MEIEISDGNPNSSRSRFGLHKEPEIQSSIRVTPLRGVISELLSPSNFTTQCIKFTKQFFSQVNTLSCDVDNQNYYEDTL